VEVGVWVGVEVIVGVGVRVGVGLDGNSCEAGMTCLYCVADHQESTTPADPTFSKYSTVMEYFVPAVIATVPQFSTPFGSLTLKSNWLFTQSAAASLCQTQM
jgi:hypothetical protein